MDSIDSLFLAVYVVEMIMKMYVFHTEVSKNNDVLTFLMRDLSPKIIDHYKISFSSISKKIGIFLISL